MALTIINLSDPVTTFVTKTNTISRNLGDIEDLILSDSNLVDAINSLTDSIAGINSTLLDLRDSGDIVTIARQAISVTKTEGIGNLTYNNATGILTYAGAAGDDIRNLFNVSDEADSYMIYDVSAGTFGLYNNAIQNEKLRDLTIQNGKIANSTLTSSKFSSAVSLVIYDSTGSAVKTLYSPGS